VLVNEILPAVSVHRPAGPVTSVVLVLHGGAERGEGRVRPWKLAYVRMVPLARAIHRAGRKRGVEVRLLRNRVYGWNGGGQSAIADARWALERIREDHPGVPIVLVGHSMGGRVSLQVADDPAVTGVAALAPWTPEGERVDAVAGRSVLIAHGTLDRMTDPAGSYSFARRAEPLTTRLVRFEIGQEGHAMLRRSAVWTRLVCAFALETADGGPRDETLAAARTKPDGERLRIPV
jgi:dienelactone hydrolase